MIICRTQTDILNGNDFYVLAYTYAYVLCTIHVIYKNDGLSVPTNMNKNLIPNHCSFMSEM